MGVRLPPGALAAQTLEGFDVQRSQGAVHEKMQIVEQLRVIPRIDGGAPIEGEVEKQSDGTIVLRHHLPVGHELETFIKPDVVGFSITTFYDGKLQSDVGPAVEIKDDEDEA